MIRPRSFREAPEFGITVITCVLAVAATISWWVGRLPVEAVMMTTDAFGRQPWRMLTSALPHVDIIHLAFNLYWLWTFGGFIEPRLGRAKFAGILMILALVSSALDFMFSTGGVGLSGIGYGLFGALWVLDRRDPDWHGCMDTKTAWMFVGWFFLCIVTTMTNILPVANVAHAAGAGMGALIGLTIASRHRTRTLLAVACAAVVAASIIVPPMVFRFVNKSHAAYDLAYRGYEASVRQDHAKAAALLEQSVALDPSDASTWVNLGSARVGLKQWQGAYDAYEQAIKIAGPASDVTEAQAHAAHELSLAAYAAGDMKGALAWAERAAQANPTIPWVHAALAVAYFNEHRPDDAIASLREASRLNPKDEYVMQTRDMLRKEGLEFD